MPNIRFTDLAIRSLSEGLYFDEGTPSFGIRVGKHRKTWLVMRGERRSRVKVSIGRYPDLSLQEARKKAYAALGKPHEVSHAPTFTEAREEFLKTHGATLRPRSLYQLKRTLNRHFHWTKRLDKITHHDITEAIRAITAPSEAAHAFKDVRTFFNWCVPRYLAHSPCAGLKSPHRYVPRDRLLTDKEIKVIWKAAGDLGDYGLQVRRLIVTGQRANQIFSLVPEWVDRKESLLRFPAEVMKGNRPHDIPYGKLSGKLLSEFPRLTNQCRNKWQLEDLCGFDDFTHHDFRRYFSSTHARLGTPIDITETLLSHITGSRSQLQRIYDRWDRLPAMREAVERYETFLLNLFRSRA